jgi:hypothetical protein
MRTPFPPLRRQCGREMWPRMMLDREVRWRECDLALRARSQTSPLACLAAKTAARRRRGACNRWKGRSPPLCPPPFGEGKEMRPAGLISELARRCSRRGKTGGRPTEGKEARQPSSSYFRLTSGSSRRSPRLLHDSETCKCTLNINSYLGGYDDVIGWLSLPSKIELPLTRIISCSDAWKAAIRKQAMEGSKPCKAFPLS